MQESVAEQPDILASFFTVQNLQKLAWFGGSEVTTEIFRYLRENNGISNRPTLWKIADEAFHLLEREYRVEYIYKSYILKKTIFGRYSPNTTSLYFEFPVANARADALLVNGNAHVYEIKTYYDDYSKLENQIREYYRCFSEVTVLVHPSLVNKVSEILPEYVGISTLSNAFTISRVRLAYPYFQQVEHSTLFSLLHKDERRVALINSGYNIPVVHPADMYDECFKLFRLIPIEKAYSLVINALRSRQSTNKYADICKRLPKSLHAAVFSYRFRKADWDSLIAIMNQPV